MTVACLLAAALAQTTPAIGSPERKAIFDALRVATAKSLARKPVKFSVKWLKLQDNWAFTYGKPVKPDGSAFDYRGTPHWEALQQGVFDDNFFALLQKRSGKWTVREWVIGATDVPWVDWPEKHKAPKAIFPKLN